MELYGSTAVMNTYLKLALLASCLVSIGVVMLTFKIYEASRDLKPIVIRISDVGRAEAISCQVVVLIDRAADQRR